MQLENLNKSELRVTGNISYETGGFSIFTREIDSNKLLLSCFDGVCFLFQKQDISGDSLVGVFIPANIIKLSWIIEKSIRKIAKR